LSETIRLDPSWPAEPGRRAISGRLALFGSCVAPEAGRGTRLASPVMTGREPGGMHGRAASGDRMEEPALAGHDPAHSFLVPLVIDHHFFIERDRPDGEEGDFLSFDIDLESYVWLAARVEYAANSEAQSHRRLFIWP